MKNILRTSLPVLFASLLLFSCVPNAKFMDVKSRQEACETQNKELIARSEALETQINEFRSNMEVAKKRIDALESDSSVMGSSLRILRSQYDKINALNDELLNKQSSLRAGTEEEKRNLMTELEQTRISLQEKENSLNKLESDLNAKEQEVEDREQKLNDLRAAINRKDSVMQALRKSVADALLGFEGKGLTVEKRDGRVYVSMEAKLLFATGSTEVDPSGKKAVIDLARAIQGRDDLSVVVEGHTDTDEFSKSTFPKNNWDLSVLRATSVIGIMIDNSQLDPKVLTASGRSSYQPVDPNNKAKNRRIEVILSPKLEELMSIINSGETE